MQLLLLPFFNHFHSRLGLSKRNLVLPTFKIYSGEKCRQPYKFKANLGRKVSLRDGFPSFHIFFPGGNRIWPYFMLLIQACISNRAEITEDFSPAPSIPFNFRIWACYLLLIRTFPFRLAQKKSPNRPWAAESKSRRVLAVSLVHGFLP